MRAIRTTILTGAILLLAGNVASAAGPDRQADATPEQVARWVRQLDDDRYWVRESATRRLVQARQAAIGPVTEAAEDANLEVTSRAVGILARISLCGEMRAEQQALDALRRLASARVTSSAARAAAVLRYQSELRRQRAIAALTRLGASMQYVPEFAAGSDSLYVVLGDEWTGGNKGLAHLKWLPDLARLGLHNNKLGDEAADHIAALTTLTRLELFGTRISDETVDALRKALPRLQELDLRRGALLGINAADHPLGCQVVRVQPESAADLADLRAGDVIERFDGNQFVGFSGLTALISKLEGGARVKLELVRNNEKMTKEVVLGRWK